jgi:tetratricopeptide (TPR) repeat protein
LASQCNSQNIQVRGLVGLATIEYKQGNWLEALKLARKAHRVAIAAGNVWGELTAAYRQALCYMALGDFKHSMLLVKQAKELVVWGGMQGGQAQYVLMGVEAEVCQAKTEYAEARHIYEAMLHQTSAVLSPVEYGYALVNIISLDLATGTETDVVSRNIHMAAAVFQSAHFSRGISLCEVHQVDLKLHKGDTGDACMGYIQALGGAYLADSEVACYCLMRLADSTHPVHAALEVLQWAIIFFAFAMHQSVRSVLTVHRALRSLGDALMQHGMENEALSVLTLALEGFTQMDVHQSRAECMQTIGDVHFRRGEISKASTLWTEARPLFERSLQAKSAADIDSRLAELEQENLQQLSNLDVSTASLQYLSISEDIPANRKEKVGASVQ